MCLRCLKIAWQMLEALSATLAAEERACPALQNVPGWAVLCAALGHAVESERALLATANLLPTSSSHSRPATPHMGDGSEDSEAGLPAEEVQPLKAARAWWQCVEALVTKTLLWAQAAGAQSTAGQVEAAGMQPSCLQSLSFTYQSLANSSVYH